MNNSDKTNLGSAPIAQLLFKLSLPAILAQIVNMLYNMVDRMYIGRIPNVGANALTGVGITMPLIMSISAFAALVSMGGAPRASIMMGKKDNEKAENILGNCTMLLIIIAIILTLIIQLFGKQLLIEFGASDNTLPFAWKYIQIYSIGTIFVQLSLGLNAFINAQGFATTGMITVVIGAIINIILDPIFIYGFNMGVSGAAIATIISQAVSCIWIICFLCGKKTILKINLKYFVLKPAIFLPCIALGLAPFIMQFTESILNVCFNTSLYQYGGDTAVGAMTILTSIMQLTTLPLSGLTQGAQPIISYNYGAKQNNRVKDTFKLLLLCCLTYSVLMWGLCMIFPAMFIRIFTQNVELIAFSVWALRFYMADSFMMGIQRACQQTFVSLGDAKISVCMALLRKIVLLIPLIYILPAFIQNKTLAVFLAEPVADFIAISVTSTLFSIRYKKL